MAEQMKTLIKYIGGGLAGFDQKWGGTQATNYALTACMKDHPEFELVARFRRDFATAAEIAAFLAGAGLTHVDDTHTITQMYQANMVPPDIIGPITRSPLKNYQGWQASYPPEWFYRARVIRLNYAEEPQHRKLVSLICHGVNTELLRPFEGFRRGFILWAGDRNRPAKNFTLMWKIMQDCVLPGGFAFMVMSNYAPIDYWRILDQTALVVNTSRYESFCCAAFEAMAKAVPVIWRANLQGGVHEAAGVRVEYSPEAYRAAILDLLQEKHYLAAGRDARQYCAQNASLAVMREDLTTIYRQVLALKGRTEP
jgi:hypothetical protein